MNKNTLLIIWTKRYKIEERKTERERGGERETEMKVFMKMNKINY